ncbi:HK97 family phage prohead protease [Methylorubrum sp. SB2]|uniref:HK97 family phage prohead protease n=1 Tax=Methylorubrum subtropicum TaxID=3138812 RepID=UPI00313EBC09
MQKKQVLQFNAEIKAADGDSGIFEGYGSVFGVEDSYNEIVDKGAFTASLKKGMPALLWQHSAHMPIGIYTEMREDGHGLFVKGQLNLEVQQGREAYSLLKQGALKGLSIGFMTEKDRYDTEKRVRHLEQVRLMEVSLVTFPANPESNVDRVKSAPESERDLEIVLRDAGYSREDAKVIVSSGYKAMLARREGGDLAAAIVGIETLTQRIRKSLPSDNGNRAA